MTVTIRTLLGTTLLVLFLAVGGSAVADTVYPPTPPTETATPTEDVSPEVTVSPSPSEDVEVLPQVLERMPVTGAALAGLLALAVAILVAGVTAVVLARRRGRATGA